MKLNNIRLCVTQYTECFLFYRDKLGFDVKWGDEESTYAEFDTGLTRLALFNREWMAQAVGSSDLPLRSAGMDSFALIFEVDNVEKVFRDLVEKDIDFVTKPTSREQWGLKTAHFRDPDGNLIEIYESLEKSSS